MLVAPPAQETIGLVIVHGIGGPRFLDALRTWGLFDIAGAAAPRLAVLPTVDDGAVVMPRGVV